MSYFNLTALWKEYKCEDDTVHALIIRGSQTSLHFPSIQKKKKISISSSLFLIHLKPSLFIAATLIWKLLILPSLPPNIYYAITD